MEEKEDKVLLFELWNECNNNCIFCFNRHVYDISDLQKLNSLDVVYKKLQDLDLYKTYSKIAFIGGEFFLGLLKDAKVKAMFFKIIDKIDWLLENNYIKEFWTTATLTIGKQEDLFEMLKHINKLECVWICTSYDAVGRFTASKLQTWEDTMLRLKEHNGRIKLNVTSIISGSFALDYVDGKFNLDEFRLKYRCSWFSKTPLLPSGCGMTKEQYNLRILDNFFPKRKEYLRFLALFKQNLSEIDYDKLYSSLLRSNALIKPCIDGQVQILLRDKTTMSDVVGKVQALQFIDRSFSLDSFSKKTCKCCSHSQEYLLYVDSDRCFICDKELIRQLV